MTVNDPEYSPDPYAHAVRHLDDAQDLLPGWKNRPYLSDQERTNLAKAEALVGIGLGLLAIASKMPEADPEPQMATWNEYVNKYGTLYQCFGETPCPMHAPGQCKIGERAIIYKTSWQVQHGPTDSSA